MAKKLTSNKAKEILHDKSVHGHPLTDKQRKFFGAIAGGAPVKAQKGDKVIIDGKEYDTSSSEYKDLYKFGDSPEGKGSIGYFDKNGILVTSKMTLPEVVISKKDKDTQEFYNNLSESNQYAFDQMTKKYGPVNITKNQGKGIFEGTKGHYNPFTNTITVNPIRGGSSYDADAYVSELAHKVQFDKSGKFDVIGDWIFNDLPNYIKGNKPYDDPSTMEYEAHSVIEPKLRDEFSDYRYEDMVEKNYNKFKSGGWLDKYEYGGQAGYTDVPFNYNSAWGGQFAMGGSLPGSVGFTYARTQGAAPSNGPYAKKTKASAENGMTYYQHGLDWKPKTISKNGSDIPKNQNAQFTLPNPRDLQRQMMNASESTAPTSRALTTGVSKENMAATSKVMSDAGKKEQKRKEQRIAQRKAAKEFDRGNINTFTFPNGQTKTKDQMDWRDKAYISGIATEGLGRFNENDESWYDAINPIHWVTEAAGALGTAPYEARESNSNLPYVTAIGMPLLMGRSMGSGSINPLGKKFWTNEVSNEQFLNNMTGGISSVVKNSGKTLGNAYTKVATGESILPVAWKSPAVGLSQEASADMFQGLANSGKLTDAERALLIEYQANSRPFTGRSGFIDETKKDALNSIIKKYNLNIDNNSILTRRFNPDNNSLGATLEGNRLNFGDRPTSFSAGVGVEGYGSGAVNRIVVPNRYTKKMGNNLLANPYGKVSDDVLNLVDESAKDYAQNAVSLTTGITPEREVLGTGLDFKRIGKVKNDIGGYDWIVKPKTTSIEKQLEKVKSAVPIQKKGGVIEDDRGQWAHPGKITKINSNQITMKGVDYPVLGISDTGDKKMMYPEQEYTFKGKNVTEIPMAQKGKTLPPIYTDDPNDPRLKSFSDSSILYNYLQKWNDLINKPGTTEEDIIKFHKKPENISAVKVSNKNNIKGKKIKEVPITSKNSNTKHFANVSYLPKPQPVLYRANPKLISIDVKQFTPELRTIQHPNIEIPNIPTGKYKVSYWDPEMKDWTERSFMTKGESDKFFNEAPTYYQTKQYVEKKSTGGWLDKYN